jgi:hypothetical protein
LVENLHGVGKIKLNLVRRTIESALVYPLMRGRDVHPWMASPSIEILLAQDPVTRTGIPEAEMKRKLPKTYGYLKLFEKPLRNRASSSVRKLMEDGAFYSMFAVGPYTIAPWKVAWRDMGSEIQVAVVGQKDGKPVCPEHHVMFVPFETPDEANYLCAVLMSAPVQLLVSGYTTTTGISTHVLEHCAVPAFKSSDHVHKSLAGLSERCHAAAAKADIEGLVSLEKEVDRIAAKLWDITADELKSIQVAQADAKRRRGEVQEEGED